MRDIRSSGEQGIRLVFRGGRVAPFIAINNRVQSNEHRLIIIKYSYLDRGRVGESVLVQ